MCNVQYTLEWSKNANNKKLSNQTPMESAKEGAKILLSISGRLDFDSSKLNLHFSPELCESGDFFFLLHFGPY